MLFGASKFSFTPQWKEELVCRTPWAVFTVEITMGVLHVYFPDEAAWKKGLPEVSLDEALEPQHEDGPKKDIGARDNVLAGSIDRVNLERAIESLPPGYRIIFVLHDIEGYEHNEIAEMMGCSIGNSKSQLHKARMKLRDLLKLSRAEKASRR